MAELLERIEHAILLGRASDNSNREIAEAVLEAMRDPIEIVVERFDRAAAERGLRGPAVARVRTALKFGESLEQIAKHGRCPNVGKKGESVAREVWAALTVQPAEATRG